MSWHCDHCDEDCADHNDCYYCGRTQPAGELTPSQIQSKIHKIQELESRVKELEDRYKNRIKKIERELGIEDDVK